jgi:hypothetical protein
MRKYTLKIKFLIESNLEQESENALENIKFRKILECVNIIYFESK